MVRTSLIFWQNSYRNRYFGHKTLSAPRRDAFEAYLAEPTIDGITNPILHWQARLENDPLAQMAIDYLSAPGMLLLS
jgi:hypothetical protein